MKNRLSISLLFAITVALFVTIFDLWFTRREWVSYYEQTFSKKAHQLSNEALAARLIYQGTNSNEILSEYLESKRRSSTIQFWEKIPGGPYIEEYLGTSELNKFLEKKDRLVASNGKVLKSSNNTSFYVVEELNDSSLLVMGVVYNSEYFLKREWEISSAVLIRYLFEILIVIVTIFLFFIRDILKAISHLYSSAIGGFQANKRDVEKGFSLLESKEVRILNASLAELHRVKENDKSKSDLYEKFLLPSLKSELNSGRKIPYFFDCALARIDINNYTKSFNSNNRTYFLQLINVFFAELVSIVQRYGGFVHEFVGDEVIIYFKSEESTNYMGLAAKSLFEIHELASELSKESRKNGIENFSVKCALVKGNLEMGQFLNRFNLSGPPLIESVRIINQVVEKTNSTILISKAVKEELISKCESHFTIESIGVFNLKGIDDAREIFELNQKSVEANFSNNEIVEIFRSEKDIINLIDILKFELNLKSASDLLHYLTHLNNVRFAPPNINVSSRCTNFFVWSIQKSNPLAIEWAIKLLGSHGTEEDLKKMKDLLLNLLYHSERQVVESSLWLLSSHDMITKKEEDFLAHHKSPRVKGLLILLRGRHYFDRKAKVELKKMLKSEIEEIKSNGFRTLLEIVNEFKRTNRQINLKVGNFADLLTECLDGRIISTQEKNILKTKLDLDLNLDIDSEKSNESKNLGKKEAS